MSHRRAGYSRSDSFGIKASRFTIERRAVEVEPKEAGIERAACWRSLTPPLGCFSEGFCARALWPQAVTRRSPVQY